VPVKTLISDTTSESLKLFYARIDIAQQSLNDGISKEEKAAYTALLLPCSKKSLKLKMLILIDAEGAMWTARKKKIE
jgi:hypothetical protein